MKTKFVLTFLLLVSYSFTYSQTTVSGTVRDGSGEPLPGVNILEKGTTNGTVTDFDGNYSIDVAAGAVLVFSYIGFNTQEVNTTGQGTIDVTLSEGVLLDEVMLVGSRSPKRTSTDTAVPVDVIDIAEVATQSGKLEVNELLQYAAPSFNANKQSGSDGADHITPATLRGLGPDQTLVLINGKRRHQSSLINIFGTKGRGNTGTDLNTIPVAAIKRIEILRDGAAAQYGSDAIAGVINIVLKDKTDGVTGTLSYGAYSTNAQGDFPEGTPNTDGYRLDTDKDGNQIGDDQNFDGGSVKAAINYGIGLGETGYVNFTTEYINKNKTLRPGFDFRRGFGEAAVEGFNLMVNAAYPITDKAEIYAFGGRNYRDTDAYAFTRNGGERVVTSIYPDGFNPRITSNIIDNSISAGFRTEMDSGWKVDISNTYGKNFFHYFIKGTLNASLEEASPTDFDAGGHSLSQNTVNLDFSKYYDDVLEGMNLAFGAEYRTENFVIFAGEPGSYGTFDENGLLITDPSTQSQPTVLIDGEEVPRPGGSQGFPGYGPSNEVDRSRSNFSLYADGELDISEAFLLSAAARFENYSDFGETLNGKLAARLKASDNINIRGSVSTGFRAPSLAQIYYNLRFTNFIGGDAIDQLLSPNNSPVTASFGIDQLNEEKAVNAGLGFTGTFGNFTTTIDGYYIHIKDRIVLTGNFETDTPGVSAAQFFVNGVDTETTGLDIILAWKKNIDDGRLSATFTGNLNKMDITDVHNGNLDAETFFGERDKAFLLASAPESKLSLNLNYAKNKFDSGLAFTRFSSIALLDFQMLEPTADYGSFANKVAAATDSYNPKIVTDIVLGYQLSESLKLNIGANNIFNEYPDQQDDWVEGGGYWDAVQMGFGGAYYYARLGFTF
ncbi:TonB-dependent receptor [Pseudozobellia thermophila]|uniref:Iron complex outermembrane recepter protein n=1 Tax=Pseudozobellia thermophila TaxID=192903 RepID=A0A1M6EZ34_9FLAO|nr:TonB-dependent receptor [Pseudozobellia thermophila]SHI90651.1 iron complex outermembrane recepter protein [Pseudozobellia thermophila]